MSDGTQRIVIVGCGYVGSALARRLVCSGREVMGIRRHPAASAGSDRLVLMEADVLDRGAIAAAVRGADALVYAVSPGERSDAAYAGAYVEGLRNVLTGFCAGAQREKRLVFVSSTAVYGQTNGEWVDEDSETSPADFAGRRLLEAERLLLGSGVTSIALRLGGIYGPGRTNLLRRALAGSIRPGPGPQYQNRIHREDCAGVIEHLLHLPRPDPVYVGVDSDPADLRDVVRYIQTELAGRTGVDTVESSAREREEGEARRSASNKRCHNSRLLRSGYQFIYPTFREGYRALYESEDLARANT